MTKEQQTIKVQLIRSVRELQDTPEVRGMINTVDYLVKVL
jgi:ribosomal protein L30/L7E